MGSDTLYFPVGASSNLTTCLPCDQAALRSRQLGQSPGLRDSVTIDRWVDVYL